ncbi:MAG: DnaJ domain-containing protein [Kofleriaceae bacterium]|nr:DnaJ domain-containing protein [Kofleriaceae bacterium]MCB9574330.1 DnaJ domain-containing protein [Kofleriaceae bacterium]
MAVAPGALATTSDRRGNADAIRHLVADRMRMVAASVDHFTLLAVGRDDPPDKIRSAYFDVARQLHPDRITASGLDDIRADAQRLFAQINAAFAVLSNPRKRQEYLQILAAGGEAAVRKQQEQAEATALRLLGAEEHFRTGEMALRRNHYDVAVREFAEAVRLNPDEGEHHALLAWATWCAAADKKAVAREVRMGLELAMKTTPKNPAAYLYLGRIARSDGHDEEAVRWFRRVLEVAPRHTEAEAELRVLESRLGRGDDDGKSGPDGKDGKKGGLFSRFRR